MNRRLVGLLVAVVLAGAATFLLIRYVNTADERARSEEELAQVFVAQGDIPAGTLADDAAGQGLIIQDQIPARAVAAGAIGSLDQILGQVATGPIFDGEVIVSGRFGDTVAQPNGLLQVPEGLQAVTVDADVVAGVAGFVQAGDTVSVVGTLEVSSGGQADDPDATGGESVSRTQYLVQNASVLAVGQRVIVPPEEGGESEEGQVQQSNERYLFTLALSPAEIEKLLFTTQQGRIWFTLVPTDQEPAETPGRTTATAFS